MHYILSRAHLSAGLGCAHMLLLRRTLRGTPETWRCIRSGDVLPPVPGGFVGDNPTPILCKSSSSATERSRWRSLGVPSILCTRMFAQAQKRVYVSSCRAYKHLRSPVIPSAFQHTQPTRTDTPTYNLSMGIATKSTRSLTNTSSQPHDFSTL